MIGRDSYPNPRESDRADRCYTTLSSAALRMIRTAWNDPDSCCIDYFKLPERAVKLETCQCLRKRTHQSIVVIFRPSAPWLDAHERRVAGRRSEGS